MESNDKKKIIIIFTVMIATMVGMSIFMRTGFQVMRKDKVESHEQPTSQKDTKEDSALIKEISVRIGDSILAMIVDDGDAGQEFAKSTPFTLEMTKLNDNEIYYEGNETLPTNAYKPKNIDAGDVMLYGDKTIVIFYDSFETEYEYTRLGRIRDGYLLKDIIGNGNTTVDFVK